MPKIEVPCGSGRTKTIYVAEESFARVKKAIEEKGEQGNIRQNTSEAVWLGGRPSVGAAVHPEQVASAQAYDKAKGIPTDYLPSGEPIFKSAGHKKRWLKAHDMHDKQDYTR